MINSNWGRFLSMRQPALNQGPGESDESRTESMVAVLQCRIMRKACNRINLASVSD